MSPFLIAGTYLLGLQAPVQFELILQAKAGMKMVDERFGRVVQRIKPCAVGTLTPKNIVYVALAFSSVGIQAGNDLEFGGAQRQLRARARAYVHVVPEELSGLLMTSLTYK